MSLLQEIQEAAVDSKIPLADLLRKCKVLAVRLRNEDFKGWVDQELEGYGEKESIPEYRILRVNSLGDFCGPFGSALRNAPIPPALIPGEFREIADTAYMTDPVGALIEVLESSKEDKLQSAWPAEFVMLLADRFYKT